MSKYFYNIFDIIDFWKTNVEDEGYPLDTDCPSTVYNTGIVKLKCFINNICPFYKTPKKEDTLVFNSLTMGELTNKTESGTLNVLTTTSGLEGLHFTPKYIYRHNYMYQKNKDGNLEEIKPKGPGVVGADQTRYKKEQSWEIVQSVFDDNVSDKDTGVGCGSQSSWEYVERSINQSEMTEEDIRIDYNTKYYNQYKNSTYNIYGKTKELKEGETKRLELRIVQMPVQNRIHNNKKGVHWKVTKMTPLFKGEDFFIRFYKQAQEPNTESDQEGKIFRDPKYDALDIFSKSEQIIYEPYAFEWDVPGGENFWRFPNNAFRISGEIDKYFLETYNFYIQAYYIIEMEGSIPSSERYFIIIPERGFPTFIQFFTGLASSGHVSKMLGKPFEGISGSALIASKWFDIVVRNHLGRLSIQFKGDFKEPPPWIVERIDWGDIKGPSGESATFEEEYAALIVPHAKLSIWGGNIKTGFIFSPLQYQKKFISFIYPPRGNAKISSDSAAWEKDSQEMPDYGTGADYFETDPLWLPLNRENGSKGKHQILFNSGPPGLKDGKVGNKEPIHMDKPLFTGDAQFYENLDELDPKTDQEQEGYFHYGKTIRSFPNTVTRGVNASRLKVNKFKYVNSKKYKHQGFDLFIGMMCGDHLFSEAEDIDDAQEWKFPPFFDEFTEFVDGEWFLPACKTPILASLRLVSPEAEEPRWDDGTSIETGINDIPRGVGEIVVGSVDVNERVGSSNYFLDASNHVLSFSHSWTESGLTSMEHSGSIQFYLNRESNLNGDITEDYSGNVTDYLLALQDKTFYIEIWAGYDGKVEISEEEEEEEEILVEKPCNFTRIPGLYKMFTGLCEGGEVSYERGKIVMNCQLKDYTTILNGMKFFNSPWFDGVKDVVAINEILKFAGFRDQGSSDPGGLMADMAAATSSGGSKYHFVNKDGRVGLFETFALPAGYNRLEQPALKFNDGDPFIDAISKIAQLSSKIFYFDEFGIAHYEDFQDIIEKDYKNEKLLVPLYFFSTNPSELGGQLVFNKVEKNYDVSGTYNHIKIISMTPEMHMLIKDHLDWQSIENPDSGGFLGYQRTAYQSEGMFGSEEAVLEAVRKYTVGFKPKIKINFETYGLPLRATDIISIGGGEMGRAEIARVVKVDHTFDPKENRWWMSVECEKYQPISAATI